MPNCCPTRGNVSNFACPICERHAVVNRHAEIGQVPFLSRHWEDPIGAVTSAPAGLRPSKLRARSSCIPAFTPYLRLETVVLFTTSARATGASGAIGHRAKYCSVTKAWMASTALQTEQRRTAVSQARGRQGDHEPNT